MIFFLQASSCILETLMTKCHKLYPISRLPALPIVFGRGIFITLHNRAKWVNPKENKPRSFPLDSKEIDKEKQKRTGNFSPHAFSMFAAGAAKIRTTLSKNEEQPVISAKEMLRCPPPEKPLSPEQWEELKREHEGFKAFEEFMLKQIVQYNRPLDVAKSLLAAVAKRDGDISYNLLLQYLNLCVSQEQMEEIYDIYDIMKTRFKVLDNSASTLLIRGLSHSPRWRDALVVLEQMEKQSIISSTNRNYRDCISGVLMNQEIHLACNLFRKILSRGRKPTLDTLQLFFDAGKCVQDDHLKNELIFILNYLRNNQIYPEEALMQSIKQWFESIPGEKWEGKVTSIKKSGQCPSCNQTLEDISLSEEEYSILKERILKDVIQGTDTFRKTTPKELEEFQRFVKQHPPFDIVIDGLNVARLTGKYNHSETLLEVVRYLAEKNLRLLVLGRKHMLKKTSQWKAENMNAMLKKADFFFTENVSQDDPFLLYATLHSGNHCRFVTRDLLRDHKACVSDSLIQRLFFKWQRGHQMVISSYIPGKRIKFEPVLSYDTVVQTTGNTWHIPYDDTSLERASYEVPVKWLCLQRK